MQLCNCFPLCWPWQYINNPWQSSDLMTSVPLRIYQPLFGSRSGMQSLPCKLMYDSVMFRRWNRILHLGNIWSLLQRAGFLERHFQSLLCQRYKEILRERGEKEVDLVNDALLVVCSALRLRVSLILAGSYLEFVVLLPLAVDVCQCVFLLLLQPGNSWINGFVFMAF